MHTWKNRIGGVGGGGGVEGADSIEGQIKA